MTTIQTSSFTNHLSNQVRKLRKTNPELSQTSAQDVVAKQHGYQNWRHFKNSIPAVVTQKFFVTLSWSWIDPVTRQWTNESLDVPLSKPLKELLPKQSDVNNLLGDWNIHYEDSLISKSVYLALPREKPQSVVREALNKNARLISFASATGLIRSKAWSKPMHGFSKFLGTRNPYCFDHTKIWRDQEGKYLITTEPYLPRLELELPELQRQSEQAGYEVTVADWLGMHNPDLSHFSRGTRLILLSEQKKGVPLTELLPKLSQLRNDFLHGTWSGKTTPI